MKKGLVVLTCVLPLVLAACGEKSSPPASSTTPPPPATSSSSVSVSVAPTVDDVTQIMKDLTLEQLRNAGQNPDAIGKEQLDKALDMIKVKAVENCKEDQSITTCDVTMSVSIPGTDQPIERKEAAKFKKVNGKWQPEL